MPAAIALVGFVLALVSLAQAQPATAWQAWQHLAGVADVGVRSDGSLVVLANARLYLVSPDGTTRDFGSFAGGGAPDAEYYFAIAPSSLGDPAGCGFAQDELFILDLTSPPAIDRVEASGTSTHFVTLDAVDTLGGITFEPVGAFGHRLLVTGTRGDHTTLFAIDCQGVVSVVTASAPLVEGGIAVAPPGFGRFGGMLVAPDENSGQLWAIDAAGTAALVATPNL